MAMFMVKPWYKKDDFDPDACFDANNTATEENFIKLLEHGVYDRKYIGYFVTLSNTVDYNGGKWDLSCSFSYSLKSLLVYFPPI